ncbi:MAG: YajQ family cyclic di-GMP-binding protein [Ignavibacteriae bacterium]|nr:YajQ family cyclic di-GMP-binding protein [Ignavibacteriota bacterium]MCB0723270.1 YajQ family cyclic di-GMP-binding protein [Ignavibacteriota bacterium]MCB9243116.1 YajQ family cyclic di-GMP-binding protein [Ignavibacteriales bacterium]
MANQFSFDIVSEIDMQEIDNAVNQASKEVQQRYDLKDTGSSYELNKNDKKITINSKDEYTLKTVVDVLQNKMIKRGISLKALQYDDVEPASGGTVRQIITLQSGISKENCKKIVKMIKDTKLKVQAAIQDEQVRVTGKAKDDLQDVISMLKGADLDFAVQFTNYK